MKIGEQYLFFCTLSLFVQYDYILPKCGLLHLQQQLGTSSELSYTKSVVAGTIAEVVGTVVEPVWGLWHGMVFVSF